MYENLSRDQLEAGIVEISEYLKQPRIPNIERRLADADRKDLREELMRRTLLDPRT